MVKNFFYSLLIALLISLSIVLIQGKINSIKIVECQKNSVGITFNIDEVLDDNDIEKLKALLKNNDLVLLADNSALNRINGLYAQYFGYKIPNLINECINHYNGFKNDFFEKNNVFIMEYASLEYKHLENFTVVGDEGFDAIKMLQLLSSNNLNNKFSVIDNVNEVSNVSYDYYKYAIINFVIILICIIILDVYKAYINGQKVALYRSFGYSKIKIFKLVFLKEKLVEYFQICIYSLVILFLYYRLYNVSYVYSITIIFILMIANFIISTLCINLFQGFRRIVKNKIFNNYLLIPILLIIAINLLYFVNTSSELHSIKEFIDSNQKQVSEEIYGYMIYPQMDIKTREKIGEQLVNKYNAFDYNKYETGAQYSLIETNYNFFNNFVINNENNQRIKFDNKNNCFHVIPKKYIDNYNEMIVGNLVIKDCEIIVSSDVQEKNDILANARIDVSNIIFVNVSFYNYDYYNLMLISDNYNNAKIKYKNVYKDLNIESEPILKSIYSYLPNWSDTMNSVYFEFITIIVMTGVSSICLMFSFNYIVSHAKKYELSILDSFGYSVLRVMRIFIFYFVIILIPSFIYIILNFNLLSLIVLVIVVIFELYFLSVIIHKKLRDNLNNNIKGDD